MLITQKRVLDYLEEWRGYIPRFQGFSADEQAGFLKAQGFASLHDLLAHVTAWFEETLETVVAAVEKTDRPAKKYDFDVFNAQAVARAASWPDPEMFSRFEQYRLKLADFTKAHPEAVAENKRVRNWLRGVVIHHAAEHSIGATRFMTLDILQNDWAEYAAGFQALAPEQQAGFLKRQGFANFREILAHIIGWWEDGMDAINAISKDPAYQHPDKDTDAYNAEAIALFGKLDEADILKKFESTRQSLIELSINLPDAIFDRKDVQEWLRADVIEHYYEHAL
ncbi:MAG: hypothetical protein HYR70_10540 [Chloroflexi bacterium]|nr:hypothetical protein [Chloroflexota bacterium]MBI3340353.1 hypothetical protein [Chloroflexota bacterium]